MEAKWTKGLSAGCVESTALVRDQGDGHGHVVYRGSPQFTEADARLFGAAADLAEALLEAREALSFARDMSSTVAGHDRCDRALVIAESALKKAGAL
jgi:hypothetical protein